ncbi:uncharacterized protein LOC114290951 [Camellia sinensis]|uniref:uncharacterized protein LOC114290951 n=1 Tax=Camellia sinensis TaxID=4442 RepID=UPI00103689EA|nr:uncharacterized protein LOC114290951 [Camellia sinensis]
MGPYFLSLNQLGFCSSMEPSEQRIQSSSDTNIPQLIPSRMELERNAFGFGMDPFTGDYKVVSIRAYHWGSGLDDDIHPSSYSKHIAIYSLRDDSWRDFKGFFFLRNVVFLPFDEPMPLKGIPELGCRHPGTNLVGHYFGVYNGSLAWIQCYPTHYMAPNVFNIWVLKDERWTRELRAGPFEGAILLSFWNKGEFLIQVEDGHLYLVDPITREMKDLRTVASQAIVYHESLVSVQRRDAEFDHSYITFRLKFDVFRDSY